MKNITVSVDDLTYRLARIRAAELDTSVSALVRGYLKSLANGTARGRMGADTVVDFRRRALDDVIRDFEARGVGLRSSDNQTRDELYDDAISGPNALR